MLDKENAELIMALQNIIVDLQNKIVDLQNKIVDLQNSQDIQRGIWDRLKAGARLESDRPSTRSGKSQIGSQTRRRLKRAR